MASMLEVLREYKHLAAKRKSEGGLPPQLEARYGELEALVRAQRSSQDLPPPAPAPRAPSESRGRPVRLGPVEARCQRAERSEERDGARARPPPVNGASVDASPRPSRRPERPTPRPPVAERPAPRSPLPEVERSEPARSGVLGGLLDRLPADARRRTLFVGAFAAFSWIVALGLPAALGVSVDRVLGGLLPWLLLIGGSAWLIVYPGVLAWREYAARGSARHLNEPDFVARLPVVEPAVWVLSLLASVLWLMLSGHSSEGLSHAVAYVLGMAVGLFAFGLTVALVIRPIARKYVVDRAYRQYIEAGHHHLAKNNPRRARRLFERALEGAPTRELAERVLEPLQKATLREAEEMRSRNLFEQANELERGLEGKAVPPAPAPSAAPSREARTLGASIDLPTTAGPPRLLSAEKLHFLAPGESLALDPTLATVQERARALERRGRAREALELLLDAGAPLDPELGRDAAKDYIGHGLLRSADAIYEALGEGQIPEFYKAVGVELARSDGGNPPPDQCLRLAQVLVGLDEPAAAVRIAIAGALSKGGKESGRKEAGRVALEICKAFGEAPPAELLEAVGDLAGAATRFSESGRKEDAVRVYRAMADQMLATSAPSTELLPVLSKLFMFETWLEDKYFDPLVDHVLASKTTSAGAVRVLTAYRQRHRDDQRVAGRLFELYLEHGKADDALRELEALASTTGSNPETLIEGFERMRRKFPDEIRVRTGLARTLVRSGRTTEAAKELVSLLTSSLRKDSPKLLIELIDTLYEWGHRDVELRKEKAKLLLDLGDASGAYECLEKYAAEGGRDPGALNLAVEILSHDLVQPTGGPSYEAHLRLAHFQLYAGNPAAAVQYLEVVRAAPMHRQEADMLLARAELAASNPRRAIQVLRDAIGGRHPSESAELHFELARAYEVVGDYKQARKLDSALERFMPGFSDDYVDRRPAFERADTQWTPGVASDTDDLEGDETEMEGRGGTGEMTFDDVLTSRTEAVSSHTLDLATALLPRYRLVRRVGSGGMGDVHLAEDQALGRQVAIKVLRRTLATDLFIAKFKEEARIVAQLSHPGIVGVFDIGQKADWSYIVMEYVAGPNLATLVTSTVPPPRPDLVSYIAKVADGMAYAHSRGVIHRDLKPANILVSPDGQVKVTDFGIARVLQSQHEETAFSAAGLQVGTVNYMAPEQVMENGVVDTRTDVYLLGTTLYFSLSRRYPYVGEAVMLRKLREDAPALSSHLPDVSAALDAAVAKAIARKQEDRFKSMTEMAAALRAVPELEITEAGGAA